MKARQEMLDLNLRQKAYYETRYDAYGADTEEISTASWFTNLWWRIRGPLDRSDKAFGVEDDILAMHRQWVGDLSERAVLDLGCSHGNPLSLWLAEHAATYRGVDLSEKAIAELNQDLSALGRKDAKAMAVDILNNDFPDHSFDVVYAKSVLHHFSDIEVLCDELNRLLKPGGIIISFDPLQTEPLNYLARMVYRPYQSDRDWEWPFTRKTLSTLDKYFELEDMQGFRGFTRLALPFLIVPFLEKIGLSIGKWGWRIDQKLARSRNLFLYMCWDITMLMRKRK